ncbi:Siroheme synthase [Ensifer adhaerens]|uniref:siroheme synthase family protein n=1 Tax=Ensifer adhaerens TaxID=106592 RepID=UPI00156A35EA|nr:SAM-dependent methyltransferase [Ensifer adhaerens]NRP20452.1 Siroheme synthase [Ensifer adhaerens]
MDALLLPRNEKALRAERPRMMPLAKLPVFWALEGRRVALAGGSDAAAWKAELLAACGAEVHVYAPSGDLGEVCARLIAGRAPHPQGSFVHHNVAWTPEVLAGAAFAIADCETEEEAQAFCQAARDAGVPANVIDKPAYCQFQFGSIVNRSPVVVSISTDGAAPILAQAIRRRIETLLPPALKDWASLAQTLRETVNARLKAGAARRAFWERFVDRAFQETPEEGVEMRLVTEMDRLSANRTDTGRVTLVGAGPGGAEHLTLKAVRALQAADVILFDHGISDEVLELARREATRFPVDERSGRTCHGQEDVHGTVVSLARAGKHVVRLTSGDPVTSEGAGEEIVRLRHQGILADVVPGVAVTNGEIARLGVPRPARNSADPIPRRPGRWSMQPPTFLSGRDASGGMPFKQGIMHEAKRPADRSPLGETERAWSGFAVTRAHRTPDPLRRSGRPIAAALARFALLITSRAGAGGS